MISLRCAFPQPEDLPPWDLTPEEEAEYKAEQARMYEQRIQLLATPRVESKQLADALRDVLPKVKSAKDKKVVQACRTLMQYDDECVERGGLTPEQEIRKHLKVLIPFLDDTFFEGDLSDCPDVAEAGDALDALRIANEPPIVRWAWHTAKRVPMSDELAAYAPAPIPPPPPPPPPSPAQVSEWKEMEKQFASPSNSGGYDLDAALRSIRPVKL